MYKTIRRLGAACVLALLSIATVNAAERLAINIEAQSTQKSLLQLAKSTDAQIMFTPEITAGLQSPAVKGSLTLEQALSQLLSGTQLTFSIGNDGIVTVEKKASNTGAKKDPNVTIEEMVITATKRSTNIQDTAMSITAIGQEDITRRNLVGMEDYLRSVPGVSFFTQGPGLNSVVIRGISVDPENEGEFSGPITGVYFGDTPISGLAARGNNTDIKLIDMERIEVLKGPQGTLYGAGAMGGVVRNIPAAPDLSEASGNVKVGYSNTSRLGGTNSDLRAVVNLPLIEETLAVRAVAYRFDTSGYYRNISAIEPAASELATTYGGVATLNDDVGAVSYTGGRVSTLWRPSEKTSVNLLYLEQKIDQDGWGQADFGIGGAYDQSRLLLRPGTTLANAGDPSLNDGLNDSVKLAQATIEHDLGWATLSSATSWVDGHVDMHRFLTAFANVPFTQNNSSGGDNIVEELRLSSQLDGDLQFILGYYYEDRSSETTFISLWGGDDDLVPPSHTFLESVFTRSRSLKHHALFGEVTYEISDQLTLTGGARWFDQERAVDQLLSINLSSPTLDHFDANSSDVLFKAGIDFKPNDDTLVYAVWSQGFRLGDVQPPNQVDTCDLDNDGFYDQFPTVSTGSFPIDSDQLDNYELGGKISALDNKLKVNTSIYYIDWSDIPISFLPICGVSVVQNAGAAKSRGVEFDTSYYFDSGLLVQLAASWVDGEITRGQNNLGEAGDRLPGAPEYTASISLSYDFLLNGNDAWVRGDYVYIGGFYNNLKQVGIEAGDFGKLDISAGVQLGQFELSLFTKNLTNEDEIASVYAQLGGNLRGTRLQPRTMGIRLGYNF